MSCRGLFGQVRKSISDRKDKMMDFLEENRIQLSEEGEVTTLTQFGSKCSSSHKTLQSQNFYFYLISLFTQNDITLQRFEMIEKAVDFEIFFCISVSTVQKVQIFKPLHPKNREEFLECK